MALLELGVIVEYEDGSKTKIEFCLSLYSNNFSSIADIIRSMIPSCEQISEYLMTNEEIDEMYQNDATE